MSPSSKYIEYLSLLVRVYHECDSALGSINMNSDSLPISTPSLSCGGDRAYLEELGGYV